MSAHYSPPSAYNMASRSVYMWLTSDPLWPINWTFRIFQTERSLSAGKQTNDMWLQCRSVNRQKLHCTSLKVHNKNACNRFKQGCTTQRHHLPGKLYAPRLYKYTAKVIREQKTPIKRLPAQQNGNNFRIKFPRQRLQEYMKQNNLGLYHQKKSLTEGVVATPHVQQ